MSSTPTPTTLTPTAPTSTRRLKSHELLALLTNPTAYSLALSPHPPLLPPSPGTLLLYDKSVCRRWRLDHRHWRMPERHVKLKVRGVERMNAIYAQQEGGGPVCRRGYWLLDRKDVVLVHYVSKDEAGGGDERADDDAVKHEARQDDSKDTAAMDVAAGKDAPPRWLRQSLEETKEPPAVCRSPSPPLPPHGLSVNASDTFMSLSSSTLLSPVFGAALLPVDELLSPPAGAVSSPVVLDVAPGWDYACGGAKLLLCCSFGHLFDPRALHCLFDQQPTRVQPVAAGVYRVVVPPLPRSHQSLDAGRAVCVSIVLTDGRVSTPAVEFEYRPAVMAAASVTHSQASFPLPTLTQSPPLPSRSTSLSHLPSLLSACSTPRLSSASHSSRAALPSGRELLSSLLSLLMSIERHLLLSSAAATFSFLSTFTLEDIQRLVHSHPSDDLLEGMLLSILQSLAPTQSTNASMLHSPASAATTPTGTNQSFVFLNATHPSLHRLLTLADAQGRQLIHLSASLGYLHLLAFLLDAGVSIHAVTASSAALTPLHLAVMGGEEEVVRAVLAMGGEEGRLDGLGRSAVELARQLGKQRLVAVFRQVQEEEERESRWQWEVEDDDEEDATTTSTVTFESSHQPPNLPASFNPTLNMLPMSPASALSPISSYLSVSTAPPPLMATSDVPAASTSDAVLSSSFSRLTLHDIGIDTSELSLHLQSQHPHPSSFATFVSHTLTHLRSWLYRRHYAALTLQAAARGMLVRRRQKRLRESAVVIQQAVRRRKERQREGGHRFHHLVQDMQERVRLKRAEMTRLEAKGGSGGGAGEDGMETGGGGETGTVSPAMDAFIGVGGAEDVESVPEHLLPLSPLATSSGMVHQPWPD